LGFLQKDGSTEWFKTLLPERVPFGGPVHPGKFGYKDMHTDSDVPTYALTEIDRSEYLEKIRGDTYGTELDNDPFGDGYQPHYTGMYKTEFDALYEQPIDQDATCPPERFQALDRRMKYWVMITKTRIVKESDSAARDYENDNDPFNPQNTAFLKEYGLPLKRKVRKMILEDSGASPFDVAPPDFQDLVRMKRMVDFSERYHPTVKPWMFTSFSHYNPDDVPAYVGWSLFATMRHELEYHPEFHPTPAGAIYDSDEDPDETPEDPIPGSSYHKMKLLKGDDEEADKVDDEEQADAEEYNLDFFNTIHIKSNSVTKITSQGRVDGYAELVVAGNGRGCGAYGYGRGKTADEALDNAYTDVSKNLLFIPLTPDRNLWTNHLHARDRKANIEIKSTIGRKDNKGGVLFVVMLELLGIRGATVKRYGSRNITSQIRAFFKALSLTGDIPAFSQNALVPVIPSPFYSNSAFVEPRNLRKVHDHAELIDNGFGYHPDTVLVKNNLDRLVMMKRMRKEYMAEQKRNKKPYKHAYGVVEYPDMKSASNMTNLIQ
jgi:ribosomal protein S5